MAGFLKAVTGTDLHTSDARSCQCAVNDAVRIQCAGECHLYDPWAFPLRPNCSAGGVEARIAAALSCWIYGGPIARSVPHGRVRYFCGASSGNVVQWAIVDFDASKSVYVVFKGTDDIMDGLIDGNFLSAEAHGLNVHSAMWNALRQPGHSVFEALRRQLSGSEEDVILCGHSLGGAYAILTALD